jgi:hypothetical protein
MAYSTKGMLRGTITESGKIWTAINAD